MLHNLKLGGIGGNDLINYISVDIELWRLDLVAWIVHVHEFNAGDIWENKYPEIPGLYRYHIPVSVFFK